MKLTTEHNLSLGIEADRSETLCETKFLILLDDGDYFLELEDVWPFNDIEGRIEENDETSIGNARDFLTELSCKLDDALEKMDIPLEDRLYPV